MTNLNASKGIWSNTSLRVKITTGVLAFSLMTAAGLYLSLSTIAQLKTFSATTPIAIDLLIGLNEFGATTNQFEKGVEEVLIANYPDRVEALTEIGKQLELSAATIDQDTATFGLNGPLLQKTAQRLLAAVAELESNGFQGSRTNRLAADIFGYLTSLRQTQKNLVDGVRAQAVFINTQRTASFKAIFRQLAGTSILTLMAYLGFVLFAMKAILDPLARLLVASHRIQRGEFGLKSGITAKDELGQLARILDETSVELGRKAEMEKLLKRKARESDIIANMVVDRELKMVDLKERIKKFEKTARTGGETEDT